MHKKLTKLIATLCLITAFCLFFTFNVLATNDEESGNTQSSQSSENEDDSNETSNETDNQTEENHEDDVHSTTANTYSPPSTSSNRQPTYTTINSLPEANLGLNNILNVILIAIGIIIILLAIAILIRLKE